MDLSTLHHVKNRNPGDQVRTVGEVTVKQRPGTAQGIVFLTLHDETDFCDVVVKPAVYEQYRALVNKSKFLRVHGKLQKVENAAKPVAFTMSINATHLFPLDFPKIETRPRHFH
jgi:DNA polymerase III alpha subunit